METEFWAAIAGAVIGGGITVFGQSLYERQRAHAADKATVAALFFKCLRIQTDFYNTRLFLEEGFARARQRGMRPAAAIMPAINRIHVVHIDPNELTIALSLQDDDLLNVLVSLQQQHEALASSLDTYNRLRAEIDAMSHGGVPDHSGFGEISIDPGEADLYHTRVEVASNFLFAWRRQAIADYHSAREAVHRLAAQMKHRYHRPIGMTDRRSGQ